MDPRSLARASAPSEEDDRRFRTMTPEQRLSLFLELCLLTDSIVRGRPAAEGEALRAPTPLSPESEALLARLMARR